MSRPHSGRLIPYLIILVLTACSTTAPPPPVVHPPVVVLPKPKPQLPPCATMPLSTFMKQALGPNFHPRQEWAGGDGDYDPRPREECVWAPIGNVYAVTIHHAEIPSSDNPAGQIRAIFCDHTRPGSRLDAADVGYHFFVDGNGQVWEGRDANHVGTHVGSRPPGLNNPGNLGICGLGSFLYEEPPAAMVDRASDLALLLARYYGHTLIVRGHRDWSGINGTPEGCTTCPGLLERAVDLATDKIKAAFPQGVTLAGGAH